MTIERILTMVTDETTKETILDKHAKEMMGENIISGYSVSKKSKVIRFTNGCSFHQSDGFWGGDNPYGVEDLFVTDGDISKVLNWLKFWDEDRDENGVLQDRSESQNKDSLVDL